MREVLICELTSLENVSCYHYHEDIQDNNLGSKRKLNYFDLRIMIKLKLKHHITSKVITCTTVSERQDYLGSGSVNAFFHPDLVFRSFSNDFSVLKSSSVSIIMPSLNHF